MSELFGTYMLMRREIARYMNVWGQTIVPPVVTAALMFFVFGHALGQRIGDFDGVPYLTFLVPGLAMQGAIMNAYANNGTTVFDSRRNGYIDDVLTSPLRDWQIVLSFTVAATTRAVLIAFLTALIAIPVASGWDVNVPLLLYVTVCASAIFGLVGILAGLYATRWDHIFVPQTFLLTPLTMLGGMFYPVSLLPAGLQTVSKWNPLLYIVDAGRASLLGVHDLPIMPSVVGLGVATVGLFAATLWAFATSPRLRG